MRAIVLGGNGFIGSHVVDALLAGGHTVTVFDRVPDKFRDPLPGVDFFLGDFQDKMAIAEALNGKDAVFHLVSTTFPGTANLDPKADVTGNLIGTLSLIESMNSMGIERLVYLSSGGTVYGPAPGHPIPEDHPLNPINSYGIVKVAIEQYLNMYQKSHGLKPIAIRAANPFGPRQAHTGVQGVISTFLRRIYENEPIEIWGDGQVVRDYLYVEDLADLCVKAAETDYCGAVNAGSGQGRSLLDVIDAISRVTKTPLEPVFKPGRKIDVRYSVLDISWAKTLFDWAPSADFDRALEQTWQWLQNTSS